MDRRNPNPPRRPYPFGQASGARRSVSQNIPIGSASGAPAWLEEFVSSSPKIPRRSASAEYVFQNSGFVDITDGTPPPSITDLTQRELKFAQPDDFRMPLYMSSCAIPNGYYDTIRIPARATLVRSQARTDLGCMKTDNPILMETQVDTGASLTLPMTNVMFRNPNNPQQMGNTTFPQQFSNTTHLQQIGNTAYVHPNAPKENGPGFHDDFDMDDDDL